MYRRNAPVGPPALALRPCGARERRTLVLCTALLIGIGPRLT